MSFISYYPFEYINYDTLTSPQSISTNCFYPSCPLGLSQNINIPQGFNPSDYSKEYTQEQINRYNKGLHNYISSRQIERDNYPDILTPVYNSSTKLNIKNYLYK